MDSIIYRTSSVVNKSIIENNFLNVNFYEVERADVSIFYCKEIRTNIFHIIFVIDEEIYTGSKYIDKISNMPLKVYINTFLFVNQRIFCVEDLHKEYSEVILMKMKALTSMYFEEYVFSDIYIKNILSKKADRILKLEYEKDEVLIGIENYDEILTALDTDIDIYYVNLTPKLQSCSNVLVSIFKKGKINIKTTIPIILIDLLEYYLGDIR